MRLGRLRGLLILLLRLSTSESAPVDLEDVTPPTDGDAARAERRLEDAGHHACPRWCLNFECDGSVWCRNGALPTPCNGCPAEGATPIVELDNPVAPTKGKAVATARCSESYGHGVGATACPKTLPFCNGFHSGASWGTCSATAAIEVSSPPPPPPPPPPLPPSVASREASIFPLVASCPENYHLCPPNEQQALAFCDVDIDCYGNNGVGACHRYNIPCPQMEGCCVVPPNMTYGAPPPPPPPSPVVPAVPVCPEHMHLCSPNTRQPTVFCDVDQDCWGDTAHCSASPACPGFGGRDCCVQMPTEQPRPERWVEPYASNANLNPRVCNQLFRDRSHLFRRMWGAASRQQNHNADQGCWGKNRWRPWEDQDPEQYFEDIYGGRYCEMTNWYEGFPYAGGIFNRDAPALLGFDDDIHGYCHNACDWASVNILALFSQNTPYNTCRNFEWQMCAVRGLLPWQGSRTIVFAKPPKDLYLDGGPPFGHCSGFTDGAPCNDQIGFANDDIFYLESCLFSAVCRNRDELFTLGVGDPFHCDLDDEGFDELKRYLLEGPSV